MVSVVIPVYRNRATLHALHARLGASLQHIAGNYDLLFVDDACPAGSSEVLAELAAADPHVRAILLEHNIGQNRAVLAGLSHVRGARAVVMDADLQDPPEAIPSLLAALDGSVAAVFAGRRGHYESSGRLLSSMFFKHTLHVLSRRRIPLDAGLFVAMHRDMIDHLLTMSDPAPYVVGLIGRAGLPLTSIPVQRDARSEGRSAYTRTMRLRLALGALRSMVRPAKPRVALDPVRIRAYLGRWELADRCP